VTHVVEGLDRARIDSLRGEGRFFWVDVSLATIGPEELAEALDLPDEALDALRTIGRRPTRKLHVDGRHVVFGFVCYVEQAVEVKVLVSGDYMLTLHHERVSLPEVLDAQAPEGRSEQYVVYAVLDAMVATAFDALNRAEQTLDELSVVSTNLRGGRVRMQSLRSLSQELSEMRRHIAPERGIFERIGEEISHVEGLDPDSERYFERIAHQLDRLVDGIDAAASSMATLIDLRLNETNYWLTVVATVFLPLTFLTGFFGMNFGWMVKEIHTSLAFWALGVALPVLGVLVIWRLVVSGAPIR
jgi:magnesium transporter